jgi:hypothetical protein
MIIKLGRGVAGAFIGSLPGMALILFAQFVVEGEAQLTVGAPGILLVPLGSIVGFAIGFGLRRPQS